MPASSSLDTKHTVFGRLLAEEGEEGGETTLDRIEKVPTEPGTDRPLRSGASASSQHAAHELTGVS